MCKNIKQVSAAINSLSESLKELNELGVIRSKKWKDDYGEWLVCQLFDGTLAKSRTQKGWDLQAGEMKIQVKCHFIPDRYAKYTLVKAPCRFDDLIIVGLTGYLKVGVMYRINSANLTPLLVLEDKRAKDTYRVMWSQLDNFKLNHVDLLQAKGMEDLVG